MRWGAASIVTAMLWSVIGGPQDRVSRSTSELAAQRVVLPNGLTVVLAESHQSPLVGMRLVYRVGARDDPPGRRGLARLVPWLMVRATKHVAEGQYDRLLDAAGAYGAGWYGTFDRTYVHVTVPSDELALPLWLWSDQMGFLSPRLDDHAIAQQLPVLQSEWGQKVEHLLDGKVMTMIQDELYPPGHPYHGGELPNPDDLRGLSADEVRAFIDAHYTPDRAVLVLTGDFDTAQAMELVVKYFGPIPAARAAAPPPAPDSPLVGETRLQIAADVESAVVTMAWRTAVAHAPDDVALDLIANLLTGSRAGWLRWRLVDELRIASSVTAEQRSRDLESIFVIRAVANPGHTTAELVDAIDQTLRKLETAPPDAHSLRGAVGDALMRLGLSYEAFGGRATAYAVCAELAVRDECITSYLSQYAVSDPARLTAVAVRQLPLRRRIVAEVTPTPGAPAAGTLRSRSRVPR
jgi:predicted Zn-dependent peptidase